MIEDSEIIKIREDRDSQINFWRKEVNLPPIKLEFFDISPKWRFKVDSLKLMNTAKFYFVDHKMSFYCVGKVLLQLNKLDEKIQLRLYKSDDKDEYFVLTRDQSSGITTNPCGKITRVFEVDSNYIIDFNTSYGVSCGGNLEDFALGSPFTDKIIPLNIEAGEKRLTIG